MKSRNPGFLLKLLVILMPLGLAAAAGCEAGESWPESQEDYWEGELFDSENPYSTVAAGKEDNLGNVYEVPTNLPALVDPEIIVSLDQLTLHLFDRETGFSEVYPVGVGVINEDGVSITPTGHFATGPDTSDAWWYIARRSVPEYFGGYPFIRLTMENSRGQNTYGMHGPITAQLIRGYVSHGCVRMDGMDLVRIFYLIRNHASTPVTVQREPERDAAGSVVDLGTEVTLWAPGDDIEYGDSVGDPPPRDDTGTDENGCADDRYESDAPAAVEPGSYVGLIMCKTDTADLYGLDLQAGDTVTVRIQFLSSIIDLDLRLKDPSGAVIDQSTTTGDAETVTATAASTGTYGISVIRYGEADTASYTMTIE
jgi:hypothetical protein